MSKTSSYMVEITDMASLRKYISIRTAEIERESRYPGDDAEIEVAQCSRATFELDELKRRIKEK